VERGFGVLQRNFQILQKKVKSCLLMVQTCILLHNMMAEERIKRDEEEDSNLYGFDDDINCNERIIDSVSDDVERVEAELELNKRLDAGYYSGDAAFEDKEAENRKSWFTFHSQCCLARWASLYNSDAHHCLP
jgi:hypothetical protein